MIEPIQKLNNGNGALLCNNCNVIISAGLLCENCIAKERAKNYMKLKKGYKL